MATEYLVSRPRPRVDFLPVRTELDIRKHAIVRLATIATGLLSCPCYACFILFEHDYSPVSQSLLVQQTPGSAHLDERWAWHQISKSTARRVCFQCTNRTRNQILTLHGLIANVLYHHYKMVLYYLVNIRQSCTFAITLSQFSSVLLNWAWSNEPRAGNWICLPISIGSKAHWTRDG